jgi:hypothetical protein
MLEAGTRLRREEDNVVGNEKFERPFGMGFEICGSRVSVWRTGEAQTADRNATFDIKSYRGAETFLARSGRKQSAPVKSVMGRGMGWFG